MAFSENLVVAQLSVQFRFEAGKEVVVGSDCQNLCNSPTAIGWIGPIRRTKRTLRIFQRQRIVLHIGLKRLTRLVTGEFTRPIVQLDVFGLSVNPFNSTMRWSCLGDLPHLANHDRRLVSVAYNVDETFKNLPTLLFLFIHFKRAFAIKLLKCLMHPVSPVAVGVVSTFSFTNESWAESFNPEFAL